VAVGEGDARVDQGALGEEGAGLFRGRLEGEVGEGVGRGVVGEGDEVVVGRGFGDCADDELAYSGGVLKSILSPLVSQQHYFLLSLKILSC
jgi:hypothetical protein